MIEYLRRIGALLCDYCLGAAKRSVRDTAGAGAIFYPTGSVSGNLAYFLTRHALEGLEAELGVWAMAGEVRTRPYTERPQRWNVRGNVKRCAFSRCHALLKRRGHLSQGLQRLMARWRA